MVQQKGLKVRQNDISWSQVQCNSCISRSCVRTIQSYGSMPSPCSPDYFEKKSTVGVKSLKEGRQNYSWREKYLLWVLLIISCFNFRIWKSFSIGIFGYRCCTICPVSESLSNHHGGLCAICLYETGESISGIEVVATLDRFKWLFGRTGIGASNHFEEVDLSKNNDEVEYPNLQYHP